MSLSTQTLKRLPKIKAGLLKGLNRDEIGRECGVTEKTIDRDIKAWLQTGLFEQWLREEWLRLHNIIIQHNPVEAYRQLTKLLGKTLVQRIEAYEQISLTEKVKIDVNVFSDDEKAILDRAARILEAKSKRKPDSIH